MTAAGVPLDGAETAVGATNKSNPNQGAAESGQDGSGDLSGSSWAAVEALAALMEPDAFNDAKWANPDRREETRQRALAHAAKVLTASDYRRVVEDDDTVKRVARALWRSDVADVRMPDTDSNWAIASANGAYQRKARVVVRALRNEDRS